ncbi:putative F-box protein [Raphanus sativus]|nr:putative F-box protein [Raphanus sativus]
MLCPDRYFFFNSESVHGLICVEKSGNPQIWNPTTRRFSTLPIPARSWREGSVSFLGYDPVDSTYKVLSLPCGERRPRQPQPRALTLGGNGLWRVIQGVPEHVPFRHGALCVNGVLYYLAAPTRPEHYTNQSLACFHVRSEKLSMIKVPWNLTSGFRSLVHCGNKLTCVISLGDDINMWTLEDAEKHEWSHRHVCLPFPRHNPVTKTRFTLKGVNGAGEFMYVPRALANPFHIIYFDPKGNSFRRCVVDGVADDQYRRQNGLWDGPLRTTSAYSNHVETLMALIMLFHLCHLECLRETSSEPLPLPPPSLATSPPPPSLALQSPTSEPPPPPCSAFLSLSVDVSPRIQLRALHNVKAQQGEAAMEANLAEPGYSLQLSSPVPIGYECGC